MGFVATPPCSGSGSCDSLRARHLDGPASWVLELSGEADIATVGVLRDELAHLATVNCEAVVVDVAGLVFCDVASAHLLLDARQTLPVTVRGARAPVQRVFDLVEALRMRTPPGRLGQ